MEPIGFAIGVVGLAGIFSVCLDVIEKVDSYKEFGTESRSIVAQFEADKHLFTKWAQDVGIDKNKLDHNYHSHLDNLGTKLIVQKILSSIQEIFTKTEGTMFNLQPVMEAGPTSFPSGIHFLTTRKKSQNPGGAVSERGRIQWSLRSKAKFISQVQQFGALVQRLYSLVPPERLTVPVSVHEGTKGNGQILNGFSNSQRLLIEMEKQIEHETRRELNIWLGASWTNDVYDNFIQRRLDGTCDWILSRQAFLDWRSSDFPFGTAKILWINGPAGHGKTILCARVVQYLSSMLESPLAYYFCSSESEIRRHPLSIMRSWMSQVISCHQDAFELACSRWESKDGRNASQTDIIDLFKSIVQHIPNCTFVVDGLDECAWVEEKWKSNDNDSPIGFFDSIRRVFAQTTTRILILSRNEPEIRYSLRTVLDNDSNQGLSEYQIRPDDVQSDAMSFSRSIVDKRLTNKSEIVKHELSQRIVDRSEGMFLWMKMLEEQLRSGKNKKQLEETIDQAPTALDHIYDRNWMKISNLPDKDKLRAFSILRWVTFALRPLTILEVTEALLIVDDDKCESLSDNELPDAIDEDYISSEILGLCGSLLETQKAAPEQDLGSMTLHLTHFSVKQYILCNMPAQGGLFIVNERLRAFNEAFQSNVLAKLCLRYINCQNVWQTSPPSRSGLAMRPFRDYAAGSWYQHIREYGSNYTEVVKLSNLLFSSNSGDWQSWKKWFDTNHDKSKLPKFQREIVPTDPLFYASLLGLRDTVIYLLEDVKMAVNHVDEFSRTALHAAALKGQTLVVKALLERGADLEIPDDAGWSPLNSASYIGQVDMVKLLLENGANVTVVSHHGWTSLDLASCNGHVDVVKLLLDNGADMAVVGNDGWTALDFASYYGHVDVVKLLLSYGADMMIVSNNGWTPLNSASCNGHIDVVKLLLEKGADVTVAKNYGRTPLNLATSKGYVDVVRLLLENGAELDARGREYRNLLHAAASKGSHSLMQLLIEIAKNTNLQSNIFEEALHLACIQGYIAIVEQLIYLGVNPREADEHGWTSLLCASWFGQIQILDHLSNGGDRDLLSPINTIPPSSWSTIERSNCLELDENLTCVRYSDIAGAKKISAALILANHPVPLQANGYYYEIEILNSGDTGEIGLGLCSRCTPFDSMPGWNFESWGYHGDDGERHFQGIGTPYGATFKTGDTIGCNVLLKGDIFFTLNGVSLGVAFQGISGKLYPAVGMRSRGAHVRANFGRAAFMYNFTKS